MNKLLAKLPPFALPFVTRSLRGGRGNRYVLFSLLLGAATLLIGLWLALGSGSFEQSLREDLKLERWEWERQRDEFVLFAHDQATFEHYERVIDNLRRRGVSDSDSMDFELMELRNHGHSLAEDAAWSSNARDPKDIALRDGARALISDDPDSIDGYGYFAWGDPQTVATLERVIELDGIPEVRRYESPLSLREALKVVGFLAALALAACVTVFGPLLVGVTQAQEQHENTLTPLTGTGLRPRELALGLASGPAVVVAIFALPQLLIFAGCVVVSGNLVAGLGLLAALATSGLFVTFAAQLLGHLVGPKRTPGIIAITLMMLLGVAWLTGGLMAASIDSETAGFAAVLPTMGLSALIAKTFGALSGRWVSDSMTATLVWSCAALVYAWLTLTVLARKIEGREGAPLGIGGALLGALTSIVLIQLAIPKLSVWDAPLRLYMGLAGLSVPFALLLMARVPLGDNPPRMRRVPVGPLLLEFSGWVVIHIIVSALVGDLYANAVHPVAMVWLSWSVVVLGLMAIRMVSLPSKVAAYLFLGFCSISLMIGYVHAIAWAMDDDLGMRDVFALSRLSPVLGLLQVAVTFAVPALLLRNLRQNLGSLRRAEPSIPANSR